MPRGTPTPTYSRSAFWFDEIFSPSNRERVLEQIATAGTEPVPAISQAVSDLKDAGQRIERLVTAIENGILAPEEVADKLRQLRDRRDRATAVLAAAEATTGQLDPQAIARLLDQLGGLVAIEATLTDEERRSNHDNRTALFKVDLARGVSVCVGGGTRYKTPRTPYSPDLTSAFQSVSGRSTQPPSRPRLTSQTPSSVSTTVARPAGRTL